VRLVALTPVQSSEIQPRASQMPDTLIDLSSTAAEQSTASVVSATSYNLFQEPWWLNAVAAGEWDEVVVKKGGQVAARLPFVHRKKLGSTWLLQPRLTPYLGPWMRPSDAKLTNRIAEEKELMQELIDALPQFDLFRQSFAPEVTYWLPFYWRGFSQTTRYTYRLSDLTDRASLWGALRENIRREIRKAEKIVIVRSDLDIECFARVWALTFARQGTRLPVSIDLLRRLDLACAQRNCRRMFFAEDGQGRIHAACFLVWSADCAYYLMGGGDPKLRNSGAGSLILWEAIAFASTVSRQFDFEGSMIEGVERFFRAFGGRPVAFFSLSKLSRRMKFLAGLYHSASALLGTNPAI
jgi:Acetyltransferase (GNAT) domain